MRWNIQSNLETSKSKDRLKSILKILLKNRGMETKKEIKDFLKPKNPLDLSPKEVGFRTNDLNKALDRIHKAIEKKEPIIIFGDYDADGITATAILWETLYKIGAKVLPFIPHREKHGYGLSVDAIDDLLLDQKPKLIITVDNGIVANEAADYIDKLGIDLIITDHHVASDNPPKALSILQTTNLAGAGVSWILSKEIIHKFAKDKDISPEDTLDLATIGTVADQVPLINFNRSIVKEGLKILSNTKRVGLHQLFSQADFDAKTINTYHINFIIAPRINAMGRLAHGMDSLRLLCTSDKNKAKSLSETLDSTNQDRKDLTYDLLNMASELVSQKNDKLIIVEHQDFHEGVIGLVAGRLTETYYKPSIVIGIGDDISKASARSVSGVNIIKLIRKAEHHLLNAGGHPMAAGFSIDSKNIEAFKSELLDIANKEIDDSLLTKELDIECELKLEDISWELLEIIKNLEPFGMANRKPIFTIKDINILEKYPIGKEKTHLKLILPSKIENQKKIDALWFGASEELEKINSTADIAFYIDENTWKGRSSLQLIIKDIQNN